MKQKDKEILNFIKIVGIGGITLDIMMQVLPLFLLMFVGLCALKIRLMDEKALQGLNTLVLNFSMPAMILRKLQTPASADLITELAWVFVLTCVTMAVAGIITDKLFCSESHARRAVLANLSMASNCAYMGFPVITAALGETVLIYAVMFVAAFNLMIWTLGAVFFAGREAIQVKKLLTNPSIWAVAVGLILFFAGWTLPSFINNSLDMLAGTTTPIAMFVIGARLLTLRWHHLTDWKLLLACVLRLVIFPAAILLLHFTSLPAQMVNVLYLCTAMPCAATTAMQSEAFGCDQELASRGIAISTAMSLLTIPLMLLLISI